MKAGLYIPCFNAEKFIGDVLEGVFRQTLRPDDILVVDDGSTDRTPEIVSRYPVRLIRHPENKGLASARNTAVKNMNTDFIASLDADCIPEPDWLKLLMQQFNTPRKAGAGGKLEEAHSSTIFDAWRSVHMKQYWGEERSTPSFLFGSNTVFRKRPIEEVGFYRNELKSNYEDVDICNRMKSKRYTFSYEPKAIVRHLKQDNIRSLLNTYWKWNLRYYQRRRFYSSVERFAFKIKDNIGLANRYIEEDVAAGRDQLLYLDFLLALHHSLMDFEYFVSQRNKKHKKSNGPVSFWLSLLDLTFFYHFDLGEKSLFTIVPKADIFLQNFFALNLVIAKLIRESFREGRFRRILCKHLLLSVYNIEDPYLLERLLNLIELHPDWSGLLKKRHPHLDTIFLGSLYTGIKEWIDELSKRFRTIIQMILTAAEKTDA